jgi:hypothetical protein
MGAMVRARNHPPELDAVKFGFNIPGFHGIAGLGLLAATPEAFFSHGD